MSKRAVAIIIAGFLTLFTGFAIRYSYGMLLPEMLPALEITKTEAGVIFSSYFITYTAFSPVFGILTDRYNIRVLLTLFIGILGIGAFLMSFSSSVFSASMFYGIAGIGHASGWVPVVILIQRWVSDKRRGIAIAFADLGSGIGIIVWSIVVPLIVATYDWRAGWMTLGIMGFFAAFMNFILVRSHPEEKTDSNQSPPETVIHDSIGATYKRIIANSKFWLIGISYLLLGFAILIPFTFLSTYAVQELNWSYSSATRLITIIAVGGIIGKMSLSALSDRVGRPKVMTLCGALIAIGSLGIVYFQGPLALGIATFVFGLGYGAIWPLYAACARDYFPKKTSGSVMGLWTLTLGVGSLASPVAAGWTIDSTGGYTWAFILAIAGGVLSLVLLLPIIKVPALASTEQ
jgi:sugar phosphate permease